ncbi:MAG: MBL fold metallo-hydrolase [Lentisphaeria bacterium]|nr:MBL fold metallo-hydrolase [Lentisphaeria bacterium]
MDRPVLSCCALVAEGLLRISDEKAPRVAGKIDFDGGSLVQFHLGILSVCSYLLSSCGTGFLIDPVREPEIYDRYIDENNIRLEGIFLTHMHGDFVAGHIELGVRYNVPVFLGRGAEAAFSHIAVDDGSEFRLGRLKLCFFSVSGPEGDSVCMTAGTGTGRPAFVFTGDVLDAPFPDGERMTPLAALDDGTRLCPAHGAPCGEEKLPTLGDVRRRAGRRRIAIDLPGGESLRVINRCGPPVADWTRPYTPERPDISLASPRSRVADIRNASVYAKEHIPFSLNIEANGRLEYWAARLFDPLAGPVFVTGETDEEIADAGRRLLVVGFEVRGFRFAAWKSAGLPLRGAAEVSPAELARRLDEDASSVVLDVRSRAEWRLRRIARSVNIPLCELPERVPEVCGKKIAAIVCASGYRSAIATGILERCGGGDVCRLSGGIGSWIEEGFPVAGIRRRSRRRPE